jgi:hypothetical protein
MGIDAKQKGRIIRPRGRSLNHERHEPHEKGTGERGMLLQKETKGTKFLKKTG